MGPDLGRVVPQQGRRGQAGFVAELLAVADRAGGAYPDDGDPVAVLSSELLDVRGLTPAGASMRSPEPEDQRGVRRGERSERDHLAGVEVDEIDHR